MLNKVTIMQDRTSAPRAQSGVVLIVALIILPIGLLVAVLLDREASHTKFYQTSLYLPVVLSMALIGFIWQLMFSRDQGLLNAVLGTSIDWYGDPSINLYSALIATSWRHVGYVMLLYLAGLKGVDLALKEAARIDGASEVQTFFHVVFPVMFPINVVVLVITQCFNLLLVPLLLVLVAGLGFMSVSNTQRSAASQLDFSDTLVSTMQTVGQTAARGRWITLWIGLAATVMAVRTLIKSLRIVHNLAWGTTRKPSARPGSTTANTRGFARSWPCRTSKATMWWWPPPSVRSAAEVSLT